MNYPIWQVPASGLLIAVVAILHVFVSHFAVGGGLFLALTEGKARRENDAGLLDYVRRHSRFFILLSLVFGAISGVGIWFTIALVHPAATASLINAFVWGWAIEWTFFVTEVAAAIVYLYGWDRLTAKQHVTVAWIYFVAAYMSLVVINGILAFMLTPGRWLETRAFWDGFFNPTYWPALAIRTLAAIGLAGVYALFTSSWITSDALQKKVKRYAVIGWVLPMAVLMPFALAWFFAAAERAGVPVAKTLGAASVSLRDLLSSLGGAKPSGQPMAQRALTTAMIALAAAIVLSLVSLATRNKGAVRVLTALTLVAGLFSVGGAEWVREDLRKPFVIGSHMFVNGLRLPPPQGSPAAASLARDDFDVDAVTGTGLLATARWTQPLEQQPSAPPPVAYEIEAGRRVFNVLCSQCHTINGYLAIRPLVRGKSSVALERTLDSLAVPRDARGNPATWSTPGVTVATWRERRMPPFAGTAFEKHALAVYLASLGGGPIIPMAQAGGVSGAAAFEKHCSVCHGDGGIPIDVRVAGKSEQEIYSMIGRLPQLNPSMPDFDGTEEERHALAAHLANIGAATKGRR